jgi:pyridoxal phosphate enzyme (YggS family)
VRIVAVSKGVRWERVKEALDAGQRDFGENYLQEAIPKIERLASVSPRWHFIGQLQSNKAARIARAFDLVHSLASASAARAISGAATQVGKVVPVMIQVRLGGGAERGGVEPEAVEALALSVCRLPGLTLDGVMGVAPLGEAARPAFARLRGVLDRLRGRGFPNAPLRELSAGMSADYGDAILEGATLVRLGSAIFGERPP